MKITCIIPAYNEERRLGTVLHHATMWADEVLVINKSSTDQTALICQSLTALGAPVKCVTVPFTARGKDNPADFVIHASNDWCFFITCSEIPTRELIDKARAILDGRGDELSVVLIPKKLWSFGVHDTRNPWSISYQPFLVNRSRATISAAVHNNFSCPIEHAEAIAYSETCHVAHFTHPTVKAFLESHIEYMQAEAESADPDTVIKRSLDSIAAWRPALSNPELFGHGCAWALYYLGCCLAAWEKKQNRDAPMQYALQAEAMLRSEWPSRLTPGDS